jgi:hypothetical protein
MCTAIEHRQTLVHESHEHFVDESRRLQRVFRPLASHVGGCELSQLGVHDRGERVESSALAFVPLDQEVRDFPGPFVQHSIALLPRTLVRWVSR